MGLTLQDDETEDCHFRTERNFSRFVILERSVSEVIESQKGEIYTRIRS